MHSALTLWGMLVFGAGWAMAWQQVEVDGISIDTQHLLAPEDPYRLAYRGRIVGCMDFETERRDGAWIRRSVRTLGLRTRLVSETRLDADSLLMRSFSITGDVVWAKMDVALRWKGDRVTGHTQTPDASGKTGPRAEVDRDFSARAYDYDTLTFFLIRGLPLETGRTFTSHVFEADRPEPRPVTLTVGEKEKALVPVGTWEAYRVDIKGEEDLERVVYVTTQSPRRVLKVTLPRELRSYELLPKSFETVLREIEDP